MSNNKHLPKKNNLGAYEINLDDTSTDDVLADFEKAFKELDHEAKSSSQKLKRLSSSGIPNTPVKPSDSAREYSLNTRSSLQDHIDLNRDHANEESTNKHKSSSSTPEKSPAPADWMSSKAAPPTAPKTSQPPKSSAGELPSQKQQPKRLPPKPTEKPHTKEQMLEDLQDIMMAINCGSNELQKFQAGHPYLIAPNIYGVWSDTLKETSISLMREYQRLRNKDLG